MNKQSVAEKVIYDSSAPLQDRNDALVLVREQASRIAALESENAVLRAAIVSAMDWLDRFGADAPISFGGEGALYNELRAALIAAQEPV